MDRRQLVTMGVAATGAWLAPSLWAQGRYPNRTVRLIVPFAPAGSTDMLGRKLAARLSGLLEQTIVVDNKAGAAGVLGCVEAARAPADGYTLLLGTTGTHAINPSTMVKPSYDAVKDFAPIALVGTQPFSLAVHPSVPAHTLPELLALLRAKPGKYDYATAGAGGIAHLSAELFKKLGGVEMTHIPYKGGGPALQDVLAGHVSILSDSFSTTLPQHRLGTLRVIAMTGERRSPVAPDIPTAAESGMPGFVSSTAGILFAPARTPRPVIDAIQRALARLMTDPMFLKEIEEGLLIEPATDSTPEKTAEFIANEIAKWAPIIKSTGTRME